MFTIDLGLTPGPYVPHNPPKPQEEECPFWAFSIHDFPEGSSIEVPDTYWSFVYRFFKDNHRAMTTRRVSPSTVRIWAEHFYTPDKKGAKEPKARFRKSDLIEVTSAHELPAEAYCNGDAGLTNPPGPVCDLGPIRARKYPFERMAIGDSFFIPGGDMKQMRMEFYFWNRLCFGTYELSLRIWIKETPDGVRVWRMR